MRIFLLSVVCTLIGLNLCNAKTRLKDCEAYLKNDTLVIRNSQVEQKWLWNKGNIQLLSFKNENTSSALSWKKGNPFALGGSGFTKNVAFEIDRNRGDIFLPDHLAVYIENQHGNVFSKRILRIFPDVATISCDYYLKYEHLKTGFEEEQHKADGTEKHQKKHKKLQKSHAFAVGFDSKHWQIKTVNFKDATDIHDNLVNETSSIPYRSSEKRQGNLLIGEDLVKKSCFFLLKEAPNTASQIAYPGFDFEVSQGGVRVPFSGFPLQGRGDEWIKGYTITMGLAENQAGCLLALRQYLKASINYDPKQYEMVMMNTWGDRGQDGKISEAFILRELEEAEALGISHFQIDDGWQQGLSANSVHRSGRLWDAWTPENWMPNKERFPNGLTKVIKSAKKKGIRLGLWFHPSNENDYATWETDAEILINLNKETGIDYFKIDGVEIPTKVAAINLERFFEKVKEETNGDVFFNLDLTAGTRGGYFSYRPYGNLFLENRYTDWANYYPFRTLRNVWSLACYFPPELLQVEFLNKWRNAGKYPADDLFAPGNYDFNYLFAIAMVGQPLAWFEATGLPAEAGSVAETISKYREVQADFHSGSILPIGDEPSGRSWTGFQSITEDGGYFLIFRENSGRSAAELQTYLPAEQQVLLHKIMGGGSEEELTLKVSSDQRLRFELPAENSFVLYRYTKED
ncbi:alpha-galactosidase [Sunxiuqinia elliptica]